VGARDTTDKNFKSAKKENPAMAFLSDPVAGVMRASRKNLVAETADARGKDELWEPGGKYACGTKGIEVL
jgi:hypothetical protein